ncbi:MAG: YcaO-like family protein [Ruminococcus sp.]|nr:YcaO-like family protein [Ruminococcus sp.]
MQYIDERFKDASPEATVERIIDILKSINIEVTEEWHDSGLENCHSLTLRAGKGFPTSNGKGITKAFARASAYGEFIERLQSGLFFYKFQSFENDEEVNLQCFAPDGKYFTKEELTDNADWFDYLTESYKGLTREELARQCEMYSHTDDGRILCLPFYSLFEDKYVYLPAGFIEHMYSANGCCVGNTKEEALVHALAEIMERKASTSAIIGGYSFPEIPEEVLHSFPTVSKILKRLSECEDLDVKIFDCSIGNAFPVVSTRIINKISHSYHVNFAADPVLEIAIQRSLTETFQSRNLNTIALNETKPILTDAGSMRVASNVLNQLETGNGYFMADYFSEEITCEKEATAFEDNSQKTNAELLKSTLELYKQLEKPLLIRNYNFLGFPCYKVIVPGFSESRAMKLLEPVQEYSIADFVSRILRNPKKFDKFDLSMVPMLNKMVANVHSKRNSFRSLSGLPLESDACFVLWNVTMAYTSLALGDIKTAVIHTDALSRSDKVSESDRHYFNCITQYLSLKQSVTDSDKLFVILNKFNRKSAVEKLSNNLAKGTLFDEYLLECDGRNCETCRYKGACHYDYIRTLIGNAGEVYRKFTEGQARENFASFR